MNTKEKRDNNSKSNKNQTKTNTLKKRHKLWQHKSGAIILIKLIRLIEVFWRHGNAEFEQGMI